MNREIKKHNINKQIKDVISKLKGIDGVHLDIGFGDKAILDEFANLQIPTVYINLCENDEIFEHDFPFVEYYSFDIFGQEDMVPFLSDVLANRKLCSISLFDTLQHLPNAEKILKDLREPAAKHSARLIISVPNITHKSIVFGLIEGNFNSHNADDANHRFSSFFANESLEKLIQNSGFSQVHNYDFTPNDFELYAANKSILQSPSTTVNKYLSHLKKIDPFGEVQQFIRIYSADKISPAIASSPQVELKTNRPFLSVITRTQGNRPQALQEVLLCLSGQTNMNFELLIMGHRLDQSGEKVVSECIGDLPEWFRKKVRLIKVDDGNRTKPLHVGFMEASGEYIAILDDDDLVFDNWVEMFFTLYQKKPGTVLRAFSVTQNWRQVQIRGEETLAATSTPDSVYCRNFDLLEQFYRNSCPSMSYAIPRYAYQKLNIHFNLELTTTEDWDLFMRSVLICGISEARETTSIYRLWENLNSSKQAHGNIDWVDNRKYFIRKINQAPSILPSGYIHKIIDLLESQKNEIPEYTPRAFYNAGAGYSEDRMLLAKKNAHDLNKWHFSLLPDDLISSIRIDPGEDGMKVLSHLNIIVQERSGDNNYIGFNSKNLKTTGIKLHHKILFIEADPQIEIFFSSELQLKEITVSYNTSTPTAIDLEDAGIRFSHNNKSTSKIKRFSSGLKQHGFFGILKVIKKRYVK